MRAHDLRHPGNIQGGRSCQVPSPAVCTGMATQGDFLDANEARVNLACMNMLIRCAFGTGFCVASTCGAANAQSSWPTHVFQTLSEGGSTCGEYIAEPGKQVVRMEWVLGYISGANSRGPVAEALAGTSFQMPATVVGWLQSYCASHPLDVMSAAAEVLRRDFLARERR
jgi:hypothetical protein